MSGDENYLDAEQDLLGGIEAGITRGQTLKEAMISLYNSGYEKQDIEKAARAYLDIVNKRKSPGVFPGDIASKASLDKKSEENEKKKKDLQEGKEKKDKSLPEPKKSPQVVSSYGEDSKKKDKNNKKSNYKLGKNVPKEKDLAKKEELRSKAATYLLVAILIFLLIALATVFLFKEELVRFINNLFG